MVQLLHTKSPLWRLILMFYAALIGILFGLMVMSYPFGAYVVFNTELGSTITHEFPLDSFFMFLAGLPVNIPVTLQLGEIFIVLWCFYLLFFAILMLGPKKNILQSLVGMINSEEPKGNSLYMVIAWLAVLLVISKVLEFVQESFGVSTGSIEFPNQLIQFFNITAAPVREELGFRVILIGIPAYFMFISRRSLANFFKTLWYPSKYTQFDQYTKKNVYMLITISAILFGLAHIFFGGGWSYGKITQAMIGGWILGWLYYRYGLHAAILLHWSTNYFVFSYGYFGNTVWGFSWDDATSNPLLASIDFLLTITGIIAIGIFLQKGIGDYLAVKRQQDSFKDTGII
jgi:hypothetical protein